MLCSPLRLLRFDPLKITTLIPAVLQNGHRHFSQGRSMSKAWCFSKKWFSSPFRCSSGPHSLILSRTPCLDASVPSNNSTASSGKNGGFSIDGRNLSLCARTRAIWSLLLTHSTQNLMIKHPSIVEPSSSVPVCSSEDYNIDPSIFTYLTFTFFPRTFI